uniref:Uncharacterized protein n=1 Tax=Oryzias latipes TaxID=8090 RepID=A0A3B3IAA2_ORYLA
RNKNIVAILSSIMKTLSACFLLVLLSAVGHTEAQFQRQVVGAMQPGQCREKMTEIHGGCFYSDTFIVTDVAKINALCLGVNGDMTTFSNEGFTVVDCTRKTENLCVYEGVVHTKSKLKLRCKNNQPVQFLGASSCFIRAPVPDRLPRLCSCSYTWLWFLSPARLAPLTVPPTTAG